MRISFILISILFFPFFFCASSKEVQKVSFKYYERSREKKIVLNIPQGGKLIKILAGGEGEEHRYWYSDSAVIYISTLSGSETLNGPLIRKTDNYDKFFFSDSACFTGVDGKGNFWKEIRKDKIVYGYANVPISKKPVFEKALSLFKKE